MAGPLSRYSQVTVGGEAHYLLHVRGGSHHGNGERALVHSEVPCGAGGVPALVACREGSAGEVGVKCRDIQSRMGDGHCESFVLVA